MLSSLNRNGEGEQGGGWRDVYTKDVKCEVLFSKRFSCLAPRSSIFVWPDFIF